MHELSICLSLLESLEAQAMKENFRRIKKIWLEIGDLAGIEIAALSFNFPLAASGTIAESARLAIIPIPGKGFCHSCNCTIEVKTLFSACPECFEYNYAVSAGKELRILKMEVE